MTAPSFDEFRFVSGSVSRETFDRLIAFEAVFRRWAARINLVAPSTLSELWTRHILDSAQLARIKPDALSWVDIGSGGGFPGAVMALILKERAGALRSIWSRAIARRRRFCRRRWRSSTLRRSVHARRIEDAYSLVRKPEIVTARALAPLGDLLRLSEPWLADGASGLFHKGREYPSEIRESADVVEV